jgi:hypothetical protein
MSRELPSFDDLDIFRTQLRFWSAAVGVLPRLPEGLFSPKAIAAAQQGARQIDESSLRDWAAIRDTGLLFARSLRGLGDEDLSPAWLLTLFLDNLDRCQDEPIDVASLNRRVKHIQTIIRGEHPATLHRSPDQAEKHPWQRCICVVLNHRISSAARQGLTVRQVLEELVRSRSFVGASSKSSTAGRPDAGTTIRAIGGI